jgi:hypothetical protein
MIKELPNWKYDYFISQLHRTAYKKHESFIINSLLQDAELVNLKPCTQHYVKRCDESGQYALLDLYYPQINLAIEIDEPHHNETLDSKRQAEVEGKISADFFRVVIKDGNIVQQVRNLKQALLAKAAQMKDTAQWREWKEPKTVDIQELKGMFKHALFVKIKGDIHPEHLMGRQTGYWKLAPWRRERVNKTVVVHDGVITRMFEDIEWIQASDQKKWGYKGKEITEGDLIGTRVFGWTWQQTVTYSKDVDAGLSIAQQQEATNYDGESEV